MSSNISSELILYHAMRMSTPVRAALCTPSEPGDYRTGGDGGILRVNFLRTIYTRVSYDE